MRRAAAAVALLLLGTAVSLVVVTGSSAEPAASCRLLSDANAARATGEDEVLVSKHSAGGGEVRCRFETGPSDPASLPPAVRVGVQLTLQLARFSGKSLAGIAEDLCVLAHKGHYPEEACTFAHRAVKAKDPLRRFQLIHRALQQMGIAEKTGDFGNPAFLAEFEPPLVGSELWIYLEAQKKLLLVTCIELRTAGKLPDNGHFPDCAYAAAHAALTKLS